VVLRQAQDDNFIYGFIVKTTLGLKHCPYYCNTNLYPTPNFNSTPVGPVLAKKTEKRKACGRQAALILFKIKNHLIPKY
jgi:hypothetical protein